jgi:hypothetical protein
VCSTRWCDDDYGHGWTGGCELSMNACDVGIRAGQCTDTSIVSFACVS